MNVLLVATASWLESAASTLCSIVPDTTVRYLWPGAACRCRCHDDSAPAGSSSSAAGWHNTAGFRQLHRSPKRARLEKFPHGHGRWAKQPEKQPGRRVPESARGHVRLRIHANAPHITRKRLFCKYSSRFVKAQRAPRSQRSPFFAALKSRITSSRQQPLPLVLAASTGSPCQTCGQHVDNIFGDSPRFERRLAAEAPRSRTGAQIAGGACTGGAPSRKLSPVSHLFSFREEQVRWPGIARPPAGRRGPWPALSERWGGRYCWLPRYSCLSGRGAPSQIIK